MTPIYNIRKFYYAIAMIVFSFVSAYMLINDDNQTAMGSQRTFLARGILCLVWSICSMWYLKDIYIHPISSNENPFRHNIIKWMGVFTIGICISTTITHMGTFKELCSDLLTFIAPLFVLLGSYIMARRYGIHSNFFFLTILLLCCCLFAYFIIFKTYNTLGDRGHFYSAYYFLFIFPILLICDKKWIRYLSTILTIIIIFSSIKRAGVLALCIGMFIYLFISTKKNITGIKHYLHFLLALLFVGVTMYYSILYVGDDIVARFLNADDTTGSGRTDIWISLLQQLKVQDTNSWIIGNGYYSTMKVSWMNKSAHNDFIETLYDYGMINTICYTGFILSSISYALQMIKQKSRYAASFAATLVMYLIISMLSIIITKHIHTIFLLNFGLLIGWNEHDKYNQHELLN